VHEGDESKRQANLRKHGVDFALVEQSEWEHAIRFEDTRERYFEQRWVSFGAIADQIHLLVFSEPEDGLTRVISLRRATKRERKLYAKELQKKGH
jgi:uncharacterized DUF497 family protein